MSLKAKIKKDYVPGHVAVIMDGNGRWAKKRGVLRTRGHEKGVDAVRETVEAAAEIGVRYLTLYAFSTENWKRPKYEVNALMKLLVRSVNKEMRTFQENNIRFKAIGDLDSLSEKTRMELEKAIGQTSQNSGLTLILAISYSSKWEIIEAVRKIAGLAANHQLEPQKIDSELFRSYLQTSQIPDPVLLIRTSGEFRISNFLLWQIAYAELYFTETLWPDFTREDFYQAILDFQGRERRFGLTSDQVRDRKTNNI
jgi:undecaprenyl diphosphate synthase